MEQFRLSELENITLSFRRRFNGEVTHTETGQRLNVLGSRFEPVEELDLSGVYEHYKSTPEDPKLYYVDSVRQDIETEECLVIYFPLSSVTSGEFEVYARPLSMFTGGVEVDSREIERFRYLGQEL